MNIRPQRLSRKKGGPPPSSPPTGQDKTPKAHAHTYLACPGQGEDLREIEARNLHLLQEDVQSLRRKWSLVSTRKREIRGHGHGATGMQTLGFP